MKTKNKESCFLIFVFTTECAEFVLIKYSGSNSEELALKLVLSTYLRWLTMLRDIHVGINGVVLLA